MQPAEAGGVRLSKVRITFGGVEPGGGRTGLEGDRVPVLGHTQHFAVSPGWEGRDEPAPLVYCCRKDFLSWFCCFVFGLAVCFLREKEVCNYFVQSFHYMSEKEEIL